MIIRGEALIKMAQSLQPHAGGGHGKTAPFTMPSTATQLRGPVDSLLSLCKACPFDISLYSYFIGFTNSTNRHSNLNLTQEIDLLTE